MSGEAAHDWPGRIWRASTSCGPSRPSRRRSPTRTGPGCEAGVYPACRAEDFARSRRSPSMWTPRWSLLGSVELGPCGIQQLLPRLLELLDAFAFQHDENVGKVDAGRLQFVEHCLGFSGPAGDGVALDLAVIRDGSHGFFR